MAEKVNSIHHQDISKSSTKRFMLLSDDLSILRDNYNYIYNQIYELFDIDPVVPYSKFSQRQDAELKRQIFFSTTEHQTTASRSQNYCVSVSHRTNLYFGTLNKIFLHNHQDKATMWVNLEMFPIPEQSGLIFVTDDRKIDTHIFSFDKISNQIIFALEDNKINVLFTIFILRFTFLQASFRSTLPPYMRIALSFTPRMMEHPIKEAVKDEIRTMNTELRKVTLCKLSEMIAKTS
ncbi:unnamed protein product [Mytilus edulis]|uniref:Uncharacterized protein n=1 Tax=Mytilus edulis TaxID=6550 RepID=A0A8S3UVY6_MYTED|nr:unnamed protein product [Mytilus edulis]